MYILFHVLFEFRASIWQGMASLKNMRPIFFFFLLMYMSLFLLVELTDDHVLDLSQEFCSVMFIGKRKLKQPSKMRWSQRKYTIEYSKKYLVNSGK